MSIAQTTTFEQFGKTDIDNVGRLDHLNESKRKHTTNAPFVHADTGSQLAKYYVLDDDKENLSTREYNMYVLKSLVAKLDQYLAEWQKSEDPIMHIYSISMQLRLHERILQSRDNSRLLLGLFEMVFNNWSDLQPNDIKTLRIELKRFSNGELTSKSLATFSKQLYRKKISIFKVEENEESKNRE